VTTYENRANLAPGFFEQAIRKYDGTRLGRQELLAEVLEDTPGARWNREQRDQCRREQAPALLRFGVAIDPAAPPERTPTRPESSSPARVMATCLADYGF
jgi:phage terminase large subunit-like protein